jgi:hypothetical protein
VFDYFVNLTLRNCREGMALEMHVAAERVSTILAMWCGPSNCIYLAATQKTLSRPQRLLDRYEDGFFELSFADIAHALR